MFGELFLFEKRNKQFLRWRYFPLFGANGSTNVHFLSLMQISQRKYFNALNDTYISREIFSVWANICDIFLYFFYIRKNTLLQIIFEIAYQSCSWYYPRQTSRQLWIYDTPCINRRMRQTRFRIAPRSRSNMSL